MGRSPERAKAAEEKLRYWTAGSRDDDVREAVREGLSIARIQKVTGLAASTIQQIVDQRPQRPPAGKKLISRLPSKTRTALGKQDAAVAWRKRSAAPRPRPVRGRMRSPGSATCRAGRKWAAPTSPGSSAKASRWQAIP